MQAEAYATAAPAQDKAPNILVTLVNLLRCFQCQQTARSTGIRAALSERKKNTAPLRTKLAKCENEAHLPTFALFGRRHPAFF